MNSEQREQSTQRNALGSRGWRIGSPFGIDICLDPSLLIIFVLIVYMLGTMVFPGWHPNWDNSTRWLVAISAAVLFFASLLAHELAHALMSRRFGIGVRRITLFLFGGVAEMEDEPHEPRAEFLIAIVGPAMSLFLGLVFSSIGLYMAGPGFADLLAEDSDAALASLSPLASLLLWLGPVNTILGIFNLVPGFPLDGGRVLRAAIWWFTGDLHRATRLASDAGRLFGWLMIFLGVMQVISGMLFQGLWLVMIGWFLSNAASTSYRMLILRDLLEGVTARDMMRTHFERVPAQMRVADFVENHLMQSSQLLWPVLEDEQLIGLVTLEEVRHIPAGDREVTTLGAVMRKDLAALTLAPGTEARLVLERLGVSGLPLAVVEGGRVLGLLSAADTAKWMALHQQ
ncbi:site-2 protease family protein [Pseudohalioglobus lutimaris]|uniref:Zinc metalloprotease n=1 Tax=Pseudohalioglobus lutimaris TaxID=1737061 RepID=A0A2N5X1S8_9GAMM|nr:site-2 protease family protein [Pseudohalioglobus lutimaris]PLW68442.1 peptidase M50 [Pseudohalioglobus lutimaris]